MSEIQPQKSRIRAHFPALAEVAYLNTGSAGPLSVGAAGAIASRAERELRHGRADLGLQHAEDQPRLAELRQRFARLLGADEDEIALTPNTTHGMNVAVWGVSWRPGDEVITTSGEHVGALLPIYAAVRRFGLSLRMVTIGDNPSAFAERVAGVLTTRTRLVVLSHVCYGDGSVLPIAAVARAASRVGALVAVDGAQSAGALQVDVHALGVDLYSVPGQKWLCGPEGVGALYVRRDRLPEVSQTFVGFASVREAQGFDETGYFIPSAGARRFEVGTVYAPTIHGMAESLRYLEEEVGYRSAFEATQAITRRCREALSAVPGVSLLSPPAHAGLTAFSVAGIEPAEVVRRLSERRVVIRSIPYPGHLRASTGFFNDESDVDRLVEGLVDVQKDLSATVGQSTASQSATVGASGVERK